jgi:hypothetical protein
MVRFTAPRRVVALLAGAALVFPLTTEPASAEVVDQGTLSERYGPEISFCGAPFVQEGVTEGRYVVVARGDGQLYFRDRQTFVESWTNTETGELVTVEGHFAGGDHSLTLNHDGTTTDVIQNVGTYVMYAENGTLLGRDAGVLRFEVVFDAEGNFISRRGLIDAGASFDFCATIAAAIG